METAGTGTGLCGSQVAQEPERGRADLSQRALQEGSSVSNGLILHREGGQQGLQGSWRVECALWQEAEMEQACD